MQLRNYTDFSSTFPVLFYIANAFPSSVHGISFLFPYSPWKADKYLGKKFSDAYVGKHSFVNVRIKPSKLAI